MRVLSFCSGIGGLELALGGEVVAFAEILEEPSKLLARRFPGVPNVGDWTKLDSLDDLAPDVIVGGLPCQSVSNAGKRQGETDQRWLFDDLVELLERSEVRPKLFMENVAAILQPRYAIPYGRLIDGCEKLGYRFEWGVTPAVDHGAPHERKRWFALGEVGGFRLTPYELRPRPAWTRPPKLLPTLRRDQRWSRGRLQLVDLALGGDAHTYMVESQYLASLVDDAGEVHDWKIYEPAIERWAEIIGRECPKLVVLISGEGRTKSERRMAPEFLEWMMGFPAGWTSSMPVDDALAALGNAVVPQQGRAAALALGLPVDETPVPTRVEEPAPIPVRTERLVVADLDGTLADDNHRLHLILKDNPDWPAYFAACVDDEPIEPVVELVRGLHVLDWRVEIWTGRSAVVKDETVTWLDDCQIVYDRLRMRAEDDYRPTEKVKGEWLRGTTVDLALDDRAHCVDWWHSKGVPVLHVRAILDERVDGAEVRMGPVNVVDRKLPI